MIREEDTAFENGTHDVTTWNEYSGLKTGHQSYPILRRREDFKITTDGMSPVEKISTGFAYFKTIENLRARETTVHKTRRDLVTVRISETSSYSDDCTRGLVPDPAFHSSVITECGYKFYDKVTDSGLNLAQDLLEGHQTTAMVRAAILFLISLKKGFMKHGRAPKPTWNRQANNRNRKKWRKEAKARAKANTLGYAATESLYKAGDKASGAWLTYIYGVAPTLKTIQDLATYEARKLGAPVRIRARKSGKRDTTNVVSANRSIRVSEGYRCEYGAMLAVPPSDDLLRMTSLDPTSIAWELFPYSFVLDMVVDIGGYLEAIEARRRYSAYLTDNYRTITSKVVHKDSEIIPYVVPPRKTSRMSGSYHGNIIDISSVRQPLNQPPAVRVPEFGFPNLGYQRIASLASLAYQAMK